MQKEFEGQLAALDVVVIYVDRAISLLRRSIEGQITITNKHDSDIMRHTLTHYVVNNLAALFDEDRRVNSLITIASRFKKQFPNNFFSEHIKATEDFKNKYDSDLKRIRKNRQPISERPQSSRETKQHAHHGCGQWRHQQTSNHSS